MIARNTQDLRLAPLSNWESLAKQNNFGLDE